MKRVGWLFAVGVALACSATARAGGPPVVLAVVDRVVLGPADKVPPRWIQLWGSFALLKADSRGYQPVVGGCLYYAIPKGHEEDCRKEWDMLRQNAGKRQVVALGHCHKSEDAGSVRRTVDRTTMPDVYPLGGVHVITNPGGNETVKALLAASKK